MSHSKVVQWAQEQDWFGGIALKAPTACEMRFMIICPRCETPREVGYKVISAIKCGHKSGHCHACMVFQAHALERGEAAFRWVFRQYRARADRKGLEWGITSKEAKTLFMENCAYCGAHPYQTVEFDFYNGAFTYNGIDRVDNDKGYVFDNCVPCCRNCNIAKATRSKKEFLTWVKRISKHQGWI